MSRHVDEISALVKRIEAEAEARGYERGKADAKREILNLLQGDDGASSGFKNAPPLAVTGYAPEVSVSNSGVDDRERAPKGTVGALVKHALSVSPGITPKEITSHARNDFERMVKPASIRSELNLGKKRGAYETKDGKWFLSDDGVKAEGQSLTGQPSALRSSEEGGDTDAAPLNSELWE